MKQQVQSTFVTLLAFCFSNVDTFLVEALGSREQVENTQMETVIHFCSVMRPTSAFSKTKRALYKQKKIFSVKREFITIDEINCL